MQDETAWLGRLMLGDEACALFGDDALGRLLARLCALLTPRLSGPGDVAEVDLTELDAAGLDDPLGLALLLSLLPEGIAQPAARDAQGCPHLGADAVERLAGQASGPRVFYRFDLAAMRALPSARATRPTRART